jgi:hypothetical protein
MDGPVIAPLPSHHMTGLQPVLPRLSPINQMLLELLTESYRDAAGSVKEGSKEYWASEYATRAAISTPRCAALHVTVDI